MSVLPLALTLVSGSRRLTPCLLIAINSVSGNDGSVVCCNKYQQQLRYVNNIHSTSDQQLKCLSKKIVWTLF